MTTRMALNLSKTSITNTYGDSSIETRSATAGRDRVILTPPKRENDNRTQDSKHSMSPQRNVCENSNSLQSMSNSTHPPSNLGHTFNKERTNKTHMEHDILTGISQIDTKSDSIRKDEQLEHKPTRGLKNLGNTCFMNCILQCLSHTLPLRDFFVSDEYKKHLKAKGDLSYAFKCVMSELWKSSFAVDSYAPRDLKRRVGVVAPRFSGYNQHDAQEFMRFLLNELHEEINKADVKGRKSPGDNESLQEACDRYLTWENSKISELFSGMLRREVCCSVCEHRSVVFIPFMDLALPIPKSKSTSSRSDSYYSTSYDTVKLVTCMHAFTEEEILDEEERPYCNNCNNLTKSTKQLSIAKLPKFLVIQLKRFSGYSVRRKLSTPVEFEERWEICDNSGKTHAYSLYGIACHSGSIYGGHYTAYCKYNKQWRCFDDMYVISENWNYVKSQEAYILFYSIQDFKHRVSPQKKVYDNTNSLQSMSCSTHPHSNPSRALDKKQRIKTTHMEHDIIIGKSQLDAKSDYTGKDEQLIREPTRGLKNLGNTCFMNCILQCLSHTLPLRDFFVSDEYKKHLKTKGDLSDAFKDAMSELWKSSFAVSSYTLLDLKRKVGIVAPRISGYNQHDAQEFMRFLLNELHEEINKADVKGRKSPGDNESLQEACDRYLTWENSLISELFSGMLRSEVCCSVCEHRSVVFIPFVDLALPIPILKSTLSRFSSYYPTSYDTVKLDACMQVFTEEEILDEKERPYCNNCNNLTKSTKQLSIAKLPKFLVIQLKRFSGYTVRRKLSTPVEFEERWEICDNSGKTHAYSLYGIACHSGSIYGGHYTAYCKYNKQWRCFDDMYVISENWNYVKSQEAYILFYSIQDFKHHVSPQKKVYDNTNSLQSMSCSTHPHSNPSRALDKKQRIKTTHMEHDIMTGILQIDTKSGSARKDEQLIREPTRGLKNLGNTCFMNCILQCLSHTLPLRDFFVSDEYKKHLKTKGDLSDAFKDAMSELWKSSFAVSSYTLLDLKRKVGIVAPRISDYDQHDAQEFMRFLLNELHEEINKADVKGRKSPGDNESLQEACDRYLTWENSLISELFSGMLRSEVCCSVCEHRSVVFIPFVDLALPIPILKSTLSRFSSYYPTSYDTVKLDACMQVFTEEEILDEKERPYCNNCNNLTKSTKQLSIAKLPKFLVIQLKRFSGYTVRRKLSTPVEFEERWEICDSSGKTHAYSLYGIACHSGGIYSGHYTAYCNYIKQWRCFDDMYVVAKNWDDVKYQEAYILFYEKIVID